MRNCALAIEKARMSANVLKLSEKNKWNIRSISSNGSVVLLHPIMHGCGGGDDVHVCVNSEECHPSESSELYSASDMVGWRTSALPQTSLK